MLPSVVWHGQLACVAVAEVHVSPFDLQVLTPDEAEVAKVVEETRRGSYQ